MCREGRDWWRALMRTFEPDLDLVDEHRRWLGGFDGQHLKNWQKLLNAEPEAAMCEAAVRRVLKANGNSVEPNESLTGADQSPDFRCLHGDEAFFVEATHISIDKATHVTKMPDKPSANYYKPLNDAIFEACRQKTRQCSNLDSPVVVAVGTFHRQASGLCFSKPNLQKLLTGKEQICRNIDVRTGESSGDAYFATDLWSAVYLRPDQIAGVAHARCPISAMLLCGFGYDSFQVRGVLHPSPVHAFDRSVLPSVDFCRLKSGYESGCLSTEWI